jgi:hypothetical protein
MVIVLGILALAVYALFFLLFGASYEIVNCYLEDKNRKELENEEEVNENVNPTYNVSDISQNRRLKDNSRRRPVPQSDDEPITSRQYIIIGLLAFVGIILQPFYLMLKIIEVMMECYRRFGCWFYFYSSY